MQESQPELFRVCFRTKRQTILGTAPNLSAGVDSGRQEMLARSIVLAVVLLVAAAAGPAGAQEATATVTVIHAVPAEDGFPADVYLNGDLIIDGFVFEAASEAFSVPAGAADLEVFAEGADPATDSPAVAAQVTLEAGVDYSVVAQLIDDAPVLSVFVNDISQVEAGQSRLTVRQTSGVGDIDVSLDGESLFEGLGQAVDATADLAAGPHEVSFLTTGETLAEQSVSFAEGELLVLYAVGSPTDDSFNLLVQRLVAQQTPPSGVPTGTGGLKARGDWAPLALLGALIVSIAVWRRQESRQP
jgi:hypothetical protein